MSFSASEEQRAHIAEVFDLLELKSFSVQTQVKQLINKTYEINGSLNAILVQSSVVSCEPVTTSISEQFTVMLMPSQKRLDEYEESHPDDDCDVFVDGEYDIGNLALEYLSLSIPENPKLAGESGDHIEFDESDEESNVSPFSALSDKLKDK